MSTPDFNGKRVWIIGASSGIGAATARALHAAGAELALSARNTDNLRRVLPENSTAEILPCDITDAAAVAQVAEQLRTRWETIDLVLIVAGTYQPMRADQFDLAAARKLLDTNLNGVLNVLAPVLPWLIAQRHGALGIVASVAGLSGLPRALIYGPSKAALINLCEALHLDLQPYGVGVHLINPGFVATPLTAQNDFHMPALMDSDDAAYAILQGIARGRFLIDFPKRFTRWLRLARCLPYPLYFWLVRKVTR